MGGCYRTDIVLTYAGSALTSGHNRTIKTHLIDSGGPLIDERATIAAREDFAVAPRPSITSAGAHSCRPGRNTSGATSRLLLNTRSFVTDRGTLARRSEEPTLFRGSEMSAQRYDVLILFSKRKQFIYLLNSSFI